MLKTISKFGQDRTLMINQSSIKYDLDDLAFDKLWIQENFSYRFGITIFHLTNLSFQRHKLRLIFVKKNSFILILNFRVKGLLLNSKVECYIVYLSSSNNRIKTEIEIAALNIQNLKLRSIYVYISFIAMLRNVCKKWE